MMRDAPQRVFSTGLAVLMLAAFTVSLGFGVVLPLLPMMVGQLAVDGGDPRLIAQATGLLTGLYMLSLFAFAPLWGALSDRLGRRRVLLIGLGGFAATMLGFGFIDSLAAVYAERFLSGLFAAAATPVAMTAAADLGGSDEARARRLALVSVAGMTGFLLGPALGLAGSSLAPAPGAGVQAMASGPALVATGSLALLGAVLVVLVLPHDEPCGGAVHRPSPRPEGRAAGRRRLLGLSFIVSAGVAVFEVGLALRSGHGDGPAQGEIAAMFMACSLVMLAAQSLVFSPWVRPAATRRALGPALAVLAGALFLAPRANGFALMLAATSAVAASAGVLAPILTYWTARGARAGRGLQIGRQTAAVSLGGAVGAAMGGLLHDLPWLPDAPSVVMAALTGAAVLVGFGLSSALGREDRFSGVRPGGSGAVYRGRGE